MQVLQPGGTVSPGHTDLCSEPTLATIASVLGTLACIPVHYYSQTFALSLLWPQ